MEPSRLLLCFLDESNQFLPGNRETAISFAGILIDSSGVVALTKRLDALLVRSLPVEDRAPETELHAYDLFHRVRTWKTLSPRQSIWIFDQVIRAITEHSLGIFFRLDRSPREDATQLERDVLQSVLQRAGRLAWKSHAHALAVCDERRDGGFRHLDGLPSLVGGFLNATSPGEQAVVIPPLCFAPSHESRVLQAADMLAFILRRRALVRQERSSKSQEAMNSLLRHLDQSDLHVSIEW